MRINNIAIKDFKGIKGVEVQQLHGLDLILGENGTGKSTRLKAIQYAMLGYVPGEGELASAIYQSSSRSNDSMSVGMEFDGFKFTRSLIKKGNAVSQKIRIQDVDVATTKAEIELNEKVGRFPVMFDIGQFTGLSDDKKKAFIFEIAKSESVDEDSVMDAVKFGYFNIALSKDTVNAVLEYVMDAEYDLLDHKSKAHLFSELELKLPTADDPNSPYNRMIDNLEMSTFGSLQDYLNEIVTRIKDIASLARQQKKEADSASHELLDLKQSGGTTSQSLGELQKEHDEKSEYQSKTREKIATNNERIRSGEIRTQRIKELKGMLAEELELIDIKSGEDMIEKATNQTKSHTETVKKRSDHRLEMEKEAELARIELQDATREDKVAETNFDKVKNVKKGLTCPIDFTLDCPVDWIPRVKILSRIKAEGRERLAKATSDMNKVAEKLQKAVVEQEVGIKNELENAETIRHLVMELDKKKNQVEARESKKKRFEKELAEYEKAENVDEQTVAPEMLVNELAGLDTLLDKLKEELAIANRNKTMLVTINETVERGEIADATLQVCKDMEAGVKNVRDIFLTDQLAPITERINELLKLIDPTFEFQMITDGKAFHMGWNRRKHVFNEEKGDPLNGLNDTEKEFIPFSSLSGGEGVLFQTAFIGAILALKDIPCKVLCIEASEVGPTYMPSLLTGLAKMEGIDNILVAHCYFDKGDFTPMGASEQVKDWEKWTVTQL